MTGPGAMALASAPTVRARAKDGCIRTRACVAVGDRPAP
jgi:hypothetical protein